MQGKKRGRASSGSSANNSDCEAEPPIEPVFNPHEFVFNESFNITSFLGRRELGNQLRTRDATRDMEPTKHYFADRHARLIRECELGPWIEQHDKIFAMTWVDNDTLVAGTKCNKLLEMKLAPDLHRSTVTEIPISGCGKRHSRLPVGLDNCGIHAISLSPSRTRLVTGGQEPCDAVVLERDSEGKYAPLGVFTGHSDWVFGLAFVTDGAFVSGSRDKSVALWRVPQKGSVANSRRAACVRLVHKHKVRDVRFSAGTSRVGSVSSDGVFILWDPNDLQPVHTYTLARKAVFMQRVDQNVVCLAMEQHVAAIGSNSHVALVDCRQRVAAFERDVHEDFDKAWGVRSLSFRDHLLTIGGGSGRIYFVDTRTNRFLPLDTERGKLLDAIDREKKRRRLDLDPGLDWAQDHVDPLDGRIIPTSLRVRGKLYLSTGTGYIRRDDANYLDLYSDLHPNQLNHACYTHEWDPTGTRLATAGGPLPSGIKGCYAAVWQS